jgi:hypothetical protein
MWCTDSKIRFGNFLYEYASLVHRLFFETIFGGASESEYVLLSLVFFLIGLGMILVFH